MKNSSGLNLGRRGVALITVLIFMTIATIAATALYRLLSSENLSSAARLRQNEAYQASQAGLNMARAWLSYNGNETAALITQFAKDAQHRPISLNDRMSASGLPNQQEFSVLLAGVDTIASGGLKVKLISTGKGHANSRYSQVAILNVDGLYRVDIPSASGDVDYDYAYFGGSMFFHGDHKLTSALINGNWTNNPLKVEKDFVITGDINLSGDKVEIGGTGCVGGNVLADNGLQARSIYVVGDASGKLRDITGDAYFNGNVDARNADLKVGGNFFAKGNLRLNQSAHSAVFQQNFCMSDNGRVIFESESNGHEFRVQNNVWMPGSGSMNGAMTEGFAIFKKFGAKSESQVYISEMYMDKIQDGNVYLHQEGDFLSEIWGAVTGEYNWRYFVSKSENRISSVTGTAPFDCADSLPNFCNKKWHTSSEGCDESSFKIDDLLATAYDAFEKKANKVACAASLTGFGSGNTTVDALNQCYRDAIKDSDPNLYNGFLVVKFTANQNDNPTGTLNGKFIIIYEQDGGAQLRLPPSLETTMLYLKEGVSGKIMQSANDASATYNYFIYTKKDIGSVEASPAPWRGSFYAEAASCAKLNNFHAGGDLIYDPKILSALIKAKAICKAGTSCGDDGDGTVDSDGNVVSGSSSKDKQWIALAPTLKISLLSQYANDEYVSVENHEMDKGVLVMPRVLYLNVGDALINGSEKAYNVVYLGGLEPSGSGTASCYYGSKFGEGTHVSETSPFESDGLYTCQYSENGYTSDFWVWVMDVSSSAKVSFDALNYNLAKACESTGEKTRNVGIQLLTDHAIPSGILYILVYEKANGASVTPLSSPSGLFTLTNEGASSGGTLYKLDLKEGLTAMSDPLFEVSIMGGCATASGFVQFQLIDQNSMDNLGLGSPSNELILLGDGAGPVAHRPINDDETVSDSIKNIPECTEYKAEDVVWTPSLDGCVVPSGIEPDPFYGPWLCPMSSIVGLTVSSNVDERICKPYFGATAVVESPDDTAFAYASLKKTPYTLSIDIQGLMGTANVYESQGEVSLSGKDASELEADAEVELLDENDRVLGTCKTGGVLYKDGKYIGSCDITVYYGQHYYVRAKGKYFDHWSYDCASKSSTNTCGTATGASTKSRIIAVVISENVTLRANYTKTGKCFNEDFKHLHPYCDEEVTPKKIGGMSWFRYRETADLDKFYGENTPQSERDQRLAQMGDFAHTEQEHCIDQCVTNWRYRYSEIADPNGTEGVGTQYKYYYDYYCSVEGDVDSTLSIADREEKYWSYYDPGIPCEEMIDRAFDDWKLPWTKGKNRNDYKKKCNNSDKSFSYRWTEGKINDNDHPPSLSAPRVYGGYYPQNDNASPWLKVINVYESRQSKLGVRRKAPSQKIKLDDGTPRDVNEVLWNIKPYIDNEKGFISGHGSGIDVTAFVTLRKEKVGYNGTYTKTFTWNGAGEANLTGNFSALVFRSNADATSYFIVGVNPGGSGTSATDRHFILCHATERNTYYSASNQTATNAINNEIFGPLNTDHCVTEDVFANIPWNSIKDRTMQLKVELDGPKADIIFSYSKETISEVDPNPGLFEGSGTTIYVKKTFNLEDPSLFGYPIPDDMWSDRIPLVDAEGRSTHIYKDPITHMKNNPEEYGYVGFVVHSAEEKIYNLNWRSGGSCGGTYRGAPGVYCGFESAEVKAGSHTVPVRYVYDYCPDQGECVCTYQYSLNGGTWIDEMEFDIPNGARKYPYGSLRIRASCSDVSGSVEPSVYEASCNGFTTYDEGGENVCYDKYNIFKTYNNANDASLFEFHRSRIAGLNNHYMTKIGVRAGAAGEELRKKYCVDTEDNVNSGPTVVVGESHYSATNFCSRQKSNGASSFAHDVNGEVTVDGVKYRVHPQENGVWRNASLETGNLMLIAHNPNADPYEGVFTNYLQLIDTIDNSNTKDYLNLKGSDITFRLHQNNVVDDIRIYLEDANGVKSRILSLDEPGLAEDESDNLNNLGSIMATRNLSGDYCNIYDHRISSDEYHSLSVDAQANYHQELCQVNLVWVRDLKRFARNASEEPGHTWSGMYPYRKFRISLAKLASGTSFDPTRVSRIYFEVENDRGGGIHISQLTVDCPTSLDVLNCKSSWNGAENQSDKTINEGQNVLFSASVPGATYCQLRIHQDGANTTYSDIKGWPKDEWFACNNAEQFFKTDSLALQCDNPTADCVARFTVVGKNSSDELDSCVNSGTNQSGGTGLKVAVKNTSYFCYGYNTDYATGVAKVPDYKSEKVTSLYDAGKIEYDGSGSISMGIDFNNASSSLKSIIKLIGPDGQEIGSPIQATDAGGDADKFARCAQWRDGTTSYNSSTKKYSNVKSWCAFFQFNPTKYGTGDYKLVMGNGNVEACKINVTVPARKLSTCVVSQNVVNKGASVVVSADGEYLDGTTGTLKVGSDTHSCTYTPDGEGAAHGTVTCGFEAPSTSGSFDMAINYAGLSLDCGSLAVTEKPSPSECKVSGDGRFNAKINNPRGITYNYRLVRCDDLLGNGCTFETDGANKVEGTSMSESILLKAGTPIGGQRYIYFFQVSTSGDFEHDVEACTANYNYEGVNVDCDLDRITAGVGQTFNFIAKNANGLASDTYMSVRDESGSEVGTVLVKADGTGNMASPAITASKKGEYTYKLVDTEGKDVCTNNPTLNVVGVSANTCNFQLADWPNTTVDKVMSKIKVAWQPDKRTKVKFAASDFQNLSGSINAKLLCSKGGDKLERKGLNMTLSDNSSVVLSDGFDVPEITDDMTCILSYDGDEVCRATISIAKPMGDAECKVGNDNNGGIGRPAPADNIGIQNAMKTPNTHFYFYYKKDKGEISSFKVMSPPSGNNTYDVQEDDNSRYDLGCPDHEVNGYECVTVYPGMNCQETNNYLEANFTAPCRWNGWYTCNYKCQGFVPSKDYKYTLCTSLPGYYSGESGQPVSCCTKTLEIGNW